MEDIDGKGGGGIEIEGVGARKKRNGRMPTLLPFIYTKLYGTQ
jgi:hypothetical protein